MTKDTKKERGTVFLHEDSWEYLRRIEKVTRRTPSQELEYALDLLRNKRHQNNLDAIKQVDDYIQRQTKQKSSEQDESH